MESPNSRKGTDVPAKKNDLEGLEFPDWSGMDFFTPRLSAAEAFQRNEEFVRSVSPEAREAMLRGRHKCEVEFEL